MFKKIFLSSIMCFEFACILVTVFILPSIEGLWYIGQQLSGSKFQYLALLPSALLVYSFKDLKEQIRIVEAHEKYVYEWPDHGMYLIVISSGVIYNLIFSAMSIYAWVFSTDKIIIASWILGSIVGAIISTVSLEINKHVARKILIKMKAS